VQRSAPRECNLAHGFVHGFRTFLSFLQIVAIPFSLTWIESRDSEFRNSELWQTIRFAKTCRKVIFWALSLGPVVVVAFDTCGWDPGLDHWRALCHHKDEPEDGLSDCETVFACPDSDGDGSHFGDDTDIDFASESSG
jgi:hypothetical protein